MESNGLANIVIGGPTQRRAALPIIAAADGPIAGFRAYLITNSEGYSSGTGGTINLALCLCKNNAPAEVIDVAWRAPDDQFPQPSSGKGIFQLWRWHSGAELVKGQAYYVVFQNIDPNAPENFVSWDLLIGPANQIGLPGVLWSDNYGPWELAAVGTPPVAGVFTTSPHLLTRVDGTYQGHSGCEVENGVIVPATMYGFPSDLPL